MLRQIEVAPSQPSDPVSGRTDLLGSNAEECLRLARKTRDRAIRQELLRLAETYRDRARALQMTAAG